MENLAPLPILDNDSAPFWEGCREKRLRLQRCSTCGKFRYPPRSLCSACGSGEAEWAALSGFGTIYSYVIYRRALHPAFQSKVPYAVAIIELEEGARMASRIVGTPLGQIHIDMPVRVVFERVSDEITLPLFEGISGQEEGQSGTSSPV